MAAPDRALIDHVCRALASAGDPTRAVGQQAYMKSAMPYRGITSGELTAILRPILGDAAYRVEDRAGWEATARTLWDDAGYREERYAALALLRHRFYKGWRDPELLPLLEHLVVTGAWWDYVDTLAAHHVSPILGAHRAEVTPVMRRWMVADDMWLRRAAILSQLPMKADTDLALLADAIDANVEGTRFGREFFIRKAIGWALRELSRTNPEFVVSFVDARRGVLSGLSQREALRRLPR